MRSHPNGKKSSIPCNNPRMHASFIETFAIASDDRLGQFKNITASAITASGISTTAITAERGDVGGLATDKLCVGSTCVDTVAFGRMLQASAQMNSMAMQTLATAVFMVNSMLGHMTLLPNQSVISLSYHGGDYAKVSEFDPTGAPAAEFATYVASAVQGAIGSSPDFTTAASATAAFLGLIQKQPVPSSIVGHNGITGVTGVDVTNQVASHLAVFSTWSAIAPSSPTATSDRPTNAATTVHAVSVLHGIVVNLLITYPYWFSA